MSVYVGTSHYVTLASAKRTYPGNVEQALEEGRIHIGKPPTKPGETLMIRDGRYFIIENPLPVVPLVNPLPTTSADRKLIYHHRKP